jgi:hypothetical protein
VVIVLGTNAHGSTADRHPPVAPECACERQLGSRRVAPDSHSFPDGLSRRPIVVGRAELASTMAPSRMARRVVRLMFGRNG